MPELSEAELAARFGFAMAVLNGNPELKALFDRAVAQTYTTERFQAELRATKWYQGTQENQRNAQILQATDPATYKANVDQLKTRLVMVAAEMGAAIPPSILDNYANHMYVFGYDDNQMRASLSKYVQYTDGRLLGQAGQWETELRSYAQDMGVTLSNATILNYVKSAAAGNTTIDDALSSIRKTAASAYPHLSERLAAGETVADIADPYRQSMASILEVNPESITVSDPTIRKALASADKDGKPVLRTIYDFENDLRKDKRWLKTKNAQDAAMEVTNRILSDFGLVG